MHEDIHVQVLLENLIHGDYPQDQLKLSHFNGKISVFGLSTTW